MEETKASHRCPHCYYTTSWDFLLARHLKQHHYSSISNCVPETYDCTRCSFKTQLKLKLWNHDKLQCNSDKTLKLPFYRCLRCQSETCSELVHQMHAASCKEVKAKRKSKKKPPHKLMHKSASDKDVPWYKCSYCDAKSNRKSNIQRHIRIVHSALETAIRFKCDKCSFETTGSLREHATLHKKSGEALELQVVAPELDFQVFLWFSCEHCDFKCKVKSDLKKHFLYRHAGVNEIRWHPCGKCDFKAKELAGLRRHSRIHWTEEEGEWFHCRLCPYKARMKSNLKRHMMRPNTHPRVGSLKT